MYVLRKYFVSTVYVQREYCVRTVQVLILILEYCVSTCVLCGV